MLLTDKLVFRWLEGFGAWSLDSATPVTSAYPAHASGLSLLLAEQYRDLTQTRRVSMEALGQLSSHLLNQKVRARVVGTGKEVGKEVGKEIKDE